MLFPEKAGTTEDMARRKQPPETSKIARAHAIAYARKQKQGDPEDDEGVKEATSPDVKDRKPEPEAEPEAELDATLDAPLDAPPTTSAPDTPVRARLETIEMPTQVQVGTPPDVPTVVEAATTLQVEEPTFMPGPREVPTGAPDDPAPPPGLVPPGDSRSMRKRTERYEFALVYRRANAVISRFGVVGARGQWRVVEYPTTASASHAYAKECSRFVSEGFSDYRE